MNEIKELGLKVANKEEAFWVERLEQFEKEKKSLENMLKMTNAIIDMCNEKIKESNNAE